MKNKKQKTKPNKTPTKPKTTEREREREHFKPRLLFGIWGHDKQMGFAGVSCAVEAMGMEAGKFGWDQSWKNLSAEAFGLYPADVSLRQPDDHFRNQMYFNKDRDET